MSTCYSISVAEVGTSPRGKQSTDIGNFAQQSKPKENNRKMKKHFVVFYSPGTLFSEDTTKPIDSWDVEKAMHMAHDIKERYKARPYGFQFITRERGAEDLDSKEVARSSTYYLGGIIETLAQVKARATDDDRILISSMEGNGYDRIITNTNSWKTTQPFREGDVLLDFKF